MSRLSSFDEQIVSCSKELRLPAMRRQYKDVAETAQSHDWSYEQFLFHLLENECQLRFENRRLVRMRRAGFPYKKYLEDLKVDCLPDDARKKLKTLQTLDFIEQSQNVILAGNPGTGKTHLAVALGIKACMADYKVLFVTIPQLITRLKESHSQRTLRVLQNQFEKYDLVICDELGYISFDKEGAELLFTHLSLRAGRKSTLITTNLGFDRWSEIFADPVLTAAIVDRLTHKAYLVNMSGSSYRLKETEAWLGNA